MTQQLARAITATSTHDSGPIRLAGHSTGGHLVTRMMCQDTPLEFKIVARIEHCLSISGLNDLRPLLHTRMNETLQLYMAQATQESAASQLPISNTRLTTWAGGDERPEFICQAKAMAHMRDGQNAETQCVIDAGHNHFSLIEGLKLPGSPITSAFVGT